MNYVIHINETYSSIYTQFGSSCAVPGSDTNSYLLCQMRRRSQMRCDANDCLYYAFRLYGHWLVCMVYYVYYMYVLEWHIRMDMSMDMSMVVCKKPHSFACEQCLYNMWMEGKEGEGRGTEQIFAVVVAVPRTVQWHLDGYIVWRRRLRSSVFWMTRMGLQYIFWIWAKWFYFFVWLMNQRIYLLEFFFYCYWWKLKKRTFFLL